MLKRFNEIYCVLLTYVNNHFVKRKKLRARKSHHQIRGVRGQAVKAGFMGVYHWLHWKVDVENKAKGSADCWAERSAKCLGFLPGTAGAAAGLRLLPGGLGERPAPTGRSSEASAAGRQGAPQPVLSAAAELVTQADVTGSRGGR